MPIIREWQHNSFQKILKNSLDLLRVTLVSVKIVENRKRTLHDSKYLSLINLFEDCIKEEDINSSKTSSKPHNHLLKIIEFFHKDSQPTGYIKGMLDDLEPLEKQLVGAFHLLQIETEKRLKKSAISELNNEKRIYELSQENGQIKRNIKALQHASRRKSLCAKWKQAAAEVLIQNHKRNLAYCTCEHNVKIKSKIVISSCSIRETHVSSVAKQIELKGELQRTRKIYDNLLRENLKQEKSARNERNQLLFQFESLVKKFDQTIGDKTKERLHLQDEYEKQEELFDLFLNSYHQQEAEYVQIVLTKKKEEKNCHKQKVLLFMMNRSARVIQKHWRKFRRAQKKAAKRNTSRRKSKKK